MLIVIYSIYGGTEREEKKSLDDSTFDWGGVCNCVLSGRDNYFKCYKEQF